MTQVLPDRAKKPVRIVTMKRLSQKQRTDLIHVGQRMSNLLFNMAQQSKGKSCRLSGTRSDSQKNEVSMISDKPSPRSERS